MRDTRRTRVVLSVLLVTALTIVVISLRGGGDKTREGAQGFFGPVENAAAAIVRPVRDFLSSIGSLGSKDQQIADLQRQNDELTGKIASEELVRNRADQLDSLLRVSGLGRYKTVLAQVVAIGPAQGFAWTVTLDAGSKDGIKPEMTVITGKGLVGRVVRVTSDNAVVALLTDATSTVGARIAGSMEIGLLNGTGSVSELELQLLDPIAPIRVGDRLVTRGSTGGRPYVAGVPVGVVTSVRGTPGQNTRVAVVAPYVDVTTLDLVGVVVEPPRTDPRDVLLPPVPSPSPSGSGSPAVSPSPQAS